MDGSICVIIREQPKELSKELKEGTAGLVESLIQLGNHSEFLFAEKGALESLILSEIRKFQKKNKELRNKVSATFVTDSSFAECTMGGSCFDHVEFFPASGRELRIWDFSPLHRYLIDRSSSMIYFASFRNRDSSVLLKYAKHNEVVALNLADYADSKYLVYKDNIPPISW